MKKHVFLILSLFFCLLSQAQSSTKIPQPAERVEGASDTKAYTDRLLAKLHSQDRNYVFVVVHRGDWRNAPENSLPAIQRAIDMKADMVEIDIQRTKDGRFVLMHDATLDRTSTGKGKVSDYTVDELSRFFLRAGQNHPTSEKIPGLEEALLLCKGKILVNIDKGGNYINEILPILQRTGTERQVIIKGKYPVSKVKEEYGTYGQMLYMPIVQADKEGAWSEIESFLQDFKPVAVELCFKKDQFELLPRFKDISDRGSRVWINTLWSSLCGGHEDDKATLNPDAHWGWVLKQHATMIQTDRPRELIEYLEKKGRRVL